MTSRKGNSGDDICRLLLDCNVSHTYPSGVERELTAVLVSICIAQQETIKELQKRVDVLEKYVNM